MRTYFATAFSQVSVVKRATDVAEVVWRTANDPGNKLRYPAGLDADALARAA